MAKRTATATKRKPVAKKKPTTKKAPAKRKAPAKKKAKDPVDELSDEIDEQLSEEFEFDDGAESLLNKTVRFKDDDGEELEGVVSKILDKTDEVTVETEDAFYDVKRELVTVVSEGDEEPEEEEEPDEDEEEEESDEDESDEDDDEEEEDEEEDGDEEEDDEAPEEALIAIADIKHPKTRTRGIDKESAKYKLIKADIKKNGQDKAIKVTDFDKPVLVSGLRRLTAMEELGHEYIRARLSTASNEDERIFEDLRDNELRENMHWLDLARSFAKLLAGKTYTPRVISRTFGYTESKISRMVGALKLPKDVISKARSDKYSQGVFLELVAAKEKAKPVLKEVQDAMSNDQHVTMQDVRALIKEHKAKTGKKKTAKKNDPSSGEPNEEPSGSNNAPAPSRSLTYSDLESTALGDNIRIRVHRKHLTVKMEIDWEKAKFSRFDLVKEIEALLDKAFSDDETSIGSKAALTKALNAAKAEISAE